MYQISRLPTIILNDEQLVVVREDTVVGPNTTYVDGKPVKSNPATFSVRANVQPLTGEDLMLVPEGDRFHDQLMLWVAPGSGPLRENDKVYRGGRAYQVQTVEDWECYSKSRIAAIDVIDQTPLAPLSSI